MSKADLPEATGKMDFLVAPGERIAELAAPLTDWFAAKLAPARDVRVTSVCSPTTNGGSSTTLFATVQWREREPVARDFAVRLKPVSYRLFLRDNFEAQFHFMKHLAGQTDVPVPQVHFLEPDAAILGAPFFVMDKVAGDVPPDYPPFHAAGFLFDASLDQRRRLWDSALQTMVRVARVDVGSLPQIVERRRDESGPEENLRHWSDSLAWVYGEEPHALLEATNDWLWRKLPKGLKTGLSWGDARVGNMIFRDWQCVAAIDWETVTLAGPQLDIAHWLLMDDFWSKYLGVKPLAGLPSREETIQQWEDLTGFKADHLDWHQVLAAYRLCIIYERVCQLKGAAAGLKDETGDTLGIHQLRETFDRYGIDPLR